MRRVSHYPQGGQPAVGPDAPADLLAIDARHVDVEQHAIETAGGQALQGHLAAVDLFHLPAPLFEQGDGELPIDGNIVNNQDSSHERD